MSIGEFCGMRGKSGIRVSPKVPVPLVTVALSSESGVGVGGTGLARVCMMYTKRSAASRIISTVLRANSFPQGPRCP